MAFTGVGDAAIRVKMEQDQRAQQAAQFDKTFDEGQRRFDIGVQADAEKEAEQRRQFDVNTSLANRRMNLFEFGAMLDQRMQDAELAGKDISRQLGLAQLKQYVAATEEEDMRRKNREQLAKGAFGSLAVSGVMNGGVMPASAIELANRELGDKDNRIVGGGVDPQSGIAFFDVQGADGSRKQLKMSPEKQYLVLHDTYGKEVADIFLSNYKENAQVTAALQRAQLKMQADAEKAQADANIRMQADAAKRNDPVRMAESLEKVAEARRRQIDAMKMPDPKVVDEMNAEIARIENQAIQLRESALPESMRAKTQEAFTVTPEMIKKYKIEPGYRITKDPTTGLNTVVWVKGGKRYSQSFKSGK